MTEVPPAFDPGLLLQHAAGLRALVRRLVLDDHRVDDVLQETWLRAMEKPPRHAGAWGSWLRTVATRLAIKSARGESSRARHETAARPDGGEAPSAAAIVEREMARRKVVDAVIALKQPYREAILLRFFQNLSAPEMAEQLGLPVETVRTRIKRGMALLRERLDAAHGGDPQAWHLGLLPLASLPVLPAAQAAAAAAAAGALWKLLTLRALAAALLLLGGFAAWRALGPAEERAAPAITFTAAELEPVEGWESAAEEPSTAAGPVLRTALADTDSARPLLVVEGRVVDASSGPVAGAEVTLYLRDRAERRSRGPWQRPQRAGSALETGADGRFRFTGPAFEETAVMVTARHATLAPSVVHDTWHHEERGALQLADIALTAGRSIAGSVRSAADAPIAGAEIRCWIDGGGPAAAALSELVGAVRSDAAGSFVLAAVPEGHCVLTVSAPEHLPAARDVTTAAGLRRTVDAGSIVLAPAALLEGLVLDGRGQPVADARVEGWLATRSAEQRGPRRGPGGWLQTTSDARGRFALRVAPDRAIALRIAHDAFATALHGPLEAGTAWTEIALAPRARLAGLVVDAPSSAPIERFTVRLRGAGRGRGEVGRIDLAGGGRFNVDGLQPGEYRIEIEAPGHVRAVSEPIRADAATPTPLTIALQRAVPLHGRVRDAATGAPIAGALVEIAPLRDHDERLLPVDAQRTDADGRFASSALAAGPCTLRISAPAHGTKILEHTLRDDGHELDIQLDAGAQIAGRVLDHRPGQRGLVVAMHESGSRRTTPIDAQTGSFELRHLAGGEHELHVEWSAGEPRGHNRGESTVQVQAGGVLHFDLASVDPRCATVRGTVAGATAPVTIVLQPLHGAEHADAEPRGNPGRMRRPEADGSFLFEDVPPATYSLEVRLGAERGARGDVLYREELDVPATATVERTLDLSKPGNPTGPDRNR
jgi:RNA polymerase sigma-70 factor (ECF subfamily)